MADGLIVSMRTAIRTQLLNYATDVSYRNHRGAAAGNHIVFSITQGTYNECLEQFQLVVSVIGIGESNTESLDNMADSVWEGLDHWLCSSPLFNCYQQTRSLVIDDTNNNNSHHRLVFTIRQFK